jgi:hypothetical protein
VQDVAAAIAATALQESPRRGRPTLLRNPVIVGDVLQALASGRSRYAAARTAGVSESVFRWWLRPGTRPVQACTVLRERVARIEQARREASTAEIVVPSVAASPAALVVATPLPVLPAVVVEAPPVSPRRPRCARGIGRSSRPGAPMMCFLADWLRGDVRRQLAAFGLVTLPPMDPRWLPAGLGHTEITRAYLAWRQATGQPGPTELQLELDAVRWYQAHRL